MIAVHFYSPRENALEKSGCKRKGVCTFSSRSDTKTSSNPLTLPKNDGTIKAEKGTARTVPLITPFKTDSRCRIWFLFYKPSTTG